MTYFVKKYNIFWNYMRCTPNDRHSANNTDLASITNIPKPISDREENVAALCDSEFGPASGLIRTAHFAAIFFCVAYALRRS